MTSWEAVQPPGRSEAAAAASLPAFRPGPPQVRSSAVQCRAAAAWFLSLVAAAALALVQRVTQFRGRVGVATAATTRTWAGARSVGKR
eukprot:7619564-Pyramimonas_sp.AAC.1